MKTGLFIGSNPVSVRNLYKLFFQKDQISTLYVKLLTNSVLEQLLSNRAHNIHTNKELFRKTVVSFYTEVQSIGLDVRILLSNLRNPSLKVITNKPIEIVYFDSSFSTLAVDKYVQNYVETRSADYLIVSVPSYGENNDCFVAETVENEYQMFDYVVLGGTFDKLHVGHKVLLSEAVMKCKKKLTVGVSGEELLKSKHQLVQLFIIIENLCEILSFSFQIKFFPNLSMTKLQELKKWACF